MILLKKYQKCLKKYFALHKAHYIKTRTINPSKENDNLSTMKPLKSVFRLQNNLCEFTAHPHKFKWLSCIDKPVLHVGVKDF